MNECKSKYSEGMVRNEIEKLNILKKLNIIAKTPVTEEEKNEIKIREDILKELEKIDKEESIKNGFKEARNSELQQMKIENTEKQIEEINNKMDHKENKSIQYKKSILEIKKPNYQNAKTLDDLFDLSKEYNTRKNNLERLDKNFKFSDFENKEIYDDLILNPLKYQDYIDEMEKDFKIKEEKDHVKSYEDRLADIEDEKEVRKARSIAYQNVKRLGGSIENAEKEALKAEIIKKVQLKMNREKRFSALVKNLNGKSNSKIISEVSHVAHSHTGKNATGNTIKEIEEKIIATEKKYEEDRIRKNANYDEELGIVKVITDNVTQISADNTKIILPLARIPDAKAETVEDENIKLDLENLRDRIRGKVTSSLFKSGLITLEGVEGILNLSEGCNEIQITRGTVYFEQSGYDTMVRDHIDVKALKHRYSKEKAPVYYIADIKNMKLDLPSILSESSHNDLLYNEFESINFKYAKKIEISSGTVICESWDVFSTELRPKVYKGRQKGSDEVPEHLKNEYNRIENIRDGMKNTKVKVSSNFGNKIVAEIEPSYGIRSELSLSDAFKKLKNSKLSEPLTKKTNAIEEYEKRKKKFNKQDFMAIIETKHRLDQRRDKVTHSSNNKSGKKGIVLGNDFISKMNNAILLKSEYYSLKLEISTDHLIKAVKNVDQETLNEIIRLYEVQRSNINPQKELMLIEKNKPIMRLKNYFYDKAAVDVLQVYFEVLSILKKSTNIFNEDLVSKNLDECEGNECNQISSPLYSQNIFKLTTPDNVVISGKSNMMNELINHDAEPNMYPSLVNIPISDRGFKKSHFKKENRSLRRSLKKEK